MAFTTVNAANVEELWDNDFFKSYVRANRFKRYMGTTENSIIHTKMDLTKKAGDGITLPLITELTGAGQTGNGLLEGNEEALGNYGHKIEVATRRHAVAVTDNDQQFTGIPLRDAAKEQLKLWAMKKLRTNIIDALGSKNGIIYASASEGDKDAWLAANSDRVMFGDGTVGGFTDHSADLALVTAGMKLTKEVVSKAKAKAELSTPIIRPVTVGEDSETYVMFVGSGAFRDLKTDLATSLQNAQERGDSNPLWNDGDLMWDGVVIRKIQEIASIGNVGATSARIEPYFLCGAQAIGVAWAQTTKSTTDVRDYGFVKGVGIHEMLGVEKLMYQNQDHGVFTGYVGALAV
ncbi:N4-gp56 family major capsid protein [Caenibius sp. WL]|uniref:N4-gp56 family major capsid protein n=1 Tax=Caenibius sp. WL TaxID=2872646 RepID=UPI001C997A34|nr:N4-gp56 family major capsid protein [Caenibius sp. WL]QZP07781.1 N4-gp56 family major capsid protein [Caenibius sp. WL]QZP09986.1 N4-gp56 family major capsid protein [Caenibius sp. WL]